MTFDSVTKDFAFGSGATKSHPIRGREPFPTLRFGVLLFAFCPFCEIGTATLRLVTRMLGLGLSGRRDGDAAGDRRGVRREREHGGPGSPLGAVGGPLGVCGR